MTGRAPAWAQELSAGAPPELVARVLRLAAAPWMHPDRVRRLLTERLDAGAATDPAAVVGALERSGAGPLPSRADAEALARRLAACAVRVGIVGEAGYPARLATAWPELGAPLWLFTRSARGALPGGPAVAVVGTRRATLEGRQTARQLARLLADHGVVVVSGMARGIDQAAHQGALDADGLTVGVLGTGLDVDYPHRDGPLRAAVAAAGGLVTEYRPGTPPRPAHFLWRNRIIAGLADVTVVVEGRARSGALQTARLAAAQGREVLAVPGSLQQPTSRAPLDLIRDGARPLTRLEDVLEVVDVNESVAHAATQPRLDGLLVGTAGLPAETADVLDLLGSAPATPDALAATSGQPVGAVLAAIGELTARGMAAATPRGIVALHRAGARHSPR